MERKADLSGASFDVSVNLFVDSMNANTKELYDRSDAMWKKIKETQREKLALERERFQAAKIDAEATLIKAKNDEKSFELTKMVEDVKILLMPLEGMDPLTKSWYMMIRDRIGKELMNAHEPAAMQSEVEESSVVPPEVEVEVAEVEEVVPSSI
jgi:hypothetical protein